MNKRVITYEEYGKLMKKFVLELQKYHRGLKFDYVYGPPRGAWPIVTHVSHHLRIPTLSKYSAYGHERADLYLFDKTLLVCDDINDTGKTFQSIDDQAPSNCKLFFAALFNKPHSNYRVDVFVEETEDWIVFPWETVDETPNR